MANILWFLPTHGDGRYLGTTAGGREVNFNYLRQIAQAADQLGYFGVLLPTGRSCEDSWVVASAVAPWTERLRYLVAVRPGLQSPTRRRAHDRDARSRLERAAADQCRHRRRSGREQGRRHLPRSQRALCGDPRVSRRLQRPARRQDRQCRGQAHPHRGRPPAVSAGAVAASAAVFRRIVGCRHRCRRRYRRQIPDLGRAAGAGRREGQARQGGRRQRAAASCPSASACM